MTCGAILRATFLGTLLLLGSSVHSQENPTPAHSNVGRRTAYPNSSDGLKKLLQDVLAAAKAGDSSKLDAFVKGMEIPDYEAWFTTTFGRERGESWAGPYGKELGENEATLERLFRNHAGENGFIATRSVNDWPDPRNDLEKSMMDSRDFQRLDIYVAEWRPDESGKPVDWIGYFYFLDGKFRWDSTFKILNIRTVRSPQISPTPPASSTTAIVQSISGNVYRNETAHFSLTVPDGWLANDVLARTSSSIGAVTSPDAKEQFMVQQILLSVSPAELAGAMDAQGNANFPGYRKVSQSELTIADEKCEALNIRFALPQSQAGIGAGLPLAAWIVLMPAQKGVLLVEFVTTDTLFEQSLPTFEAIIKSYSSILDAAP